MSPVFCVLVLMAGFAAANEPKETAAEHIIATLHEQKLSYEKDLRTTPYREVMEDLEKRYKVIIVTAKSKFGEDGSNIGDSKAEKLDAKSLDGVSIHGFLKTYLEALPIADVTYIGGRIASKSLRRPQSRRKSDFWRKPRRAMPTTG
jgi:hypothetical protein